MIALFSQTSSKVIKASEIEYTSTLALRQWNKDNLLGSHLNAIVRDEPFFEWSRGAVNVGHYLDSNDSQVPFMIIEILTIARHWSNPQLCSEKNINSNWNHGKSTAHSNCLGVAVKNIKGERDQGCSHVTWGPNLTMGNK